MIETGEYIDTVGGLYDWLGSLLASNPSLRECGVFVLDGDNLNTDHFLWCDDGGDCAPIESATGVTIFTTERPYEPPPDEAALHERESRVRGAEDRLLSLINQIITIGNQLADSR